MKRQKNMSVIIKEGEREKKRINLKREREIQKQIKTISKPGIK